MKLFAADLRVLQGTTEALHSAPEPAPGHDAKPNDTIVHVHAVACHESNEGLVWQVPEL
ncbi:MAG: hypothetical protein KTR32_34230 [Granulosicoccus sp.]|nr:hypothetical protein [Granulosicoccus sp.]